MRIALICFLLFAGCLPADAFGRKLLDSKPTHAFAQSLKNNIRRKMRMFRFPSRPAVLPSRFLTVGKPLAFPARLQRQENILSSLAFPLDSEGALMGSGFVLRSASGGLYAVAAYHVAGSAGKSRSVHLFRPDGTGVVYENLKVVSGGMFGVNAPDVSLVELPEEAAEFVRPLDIAPAPPMPGQHLFMWGLPYDSPELSLVKNLRVEDAYGMKVVLQPQENVEILEGMCGSPVFDEDGLVTGIYSGRGLVEGDMFAVDARKSLHWLLQKYEGGVFVPYEFRFMGRSALMLAEAENVGRIRHVQSDGSLLKEVNFPVYRDRLDASRLEDLFPDARTGDVLEFEIIKDRMVVRWILFKVP